MTSAPLLPTLHDGRRHHTDVRSALLDPTRQYLQCPALTGPAAPATVSLDEIATNDIQSSDGTNATLCSKCCFQQHVLAMRWQRQRLPGGIPDRHTIVWVEGHRTPTDGLIHDLIATNGYPATTTETVRGQLHLTTVPTRLVRACSWRRHAVRLEQAVDDLDRTAATAQQLLEDGHPLHAAIHGAVLIDTATPTLTADVTC